MTSPTRALATISGLVFGFLSVVSFQNCSGGFRSVNLESLSLASLSEAELSKGQKLYEVHCSQCHQDIERTQKPNKTAQQIRASILSVPEMKHLSSLGEDQLSWIAKAVVKVEQRELLSHLNFTCDASQQRARGVTRARIERLTKSEIVNSLEVLLGANVTSDSLIQQNLRRISNDTLISSPSDLPYSHSPELMDVLVKVSERAFQLLTVNASTTKAFFGSCWEGAAVPGSNCVSQFINDFGLLTYRRPLTDPEKSSYIQMYNGVQSASSQAKDGMKAIFQRMLLNPQMAFHLEVGSDLIESSKRRLTAYEVASRLSFGLTNSPPDRILLDAAARGELGDLQALRRQGARLMEVRKKFAQQKSEQFISYYAGLERIDSPFPAVISDSGFSGDGLVDEMKTEALDFANHVIWARRGGFGQLVTSNEVFPRSDRMAAILETAKVTGIKPISTTSKHAGLFLRPAYLASSYDRTHIIRRGLKITKNVSCQLAPGNPVSAEELAKATSGLDAPIENMTNREYVSKLTSSASCIGCHVTFNPPGFVLESYDQMGRFRTLEKVFGSQGRVTKTFPIDSSVSDTRVKNPSITPAKDAQDLIKHIAESQNAKACFSRNLFEFFNRQVADQSRDGCTLKEVFYSSSTGSVIDAIISTVVNESIFWKKVN